MHFLVDSREENENTPMVTAGHANPETLRECKNESQKETRIKGLWVKVLMEEILTLSSWRWVTCCSFCLILVQKGTTFTVILVVYYVVSLFMYGNNKLEDGRLSFLLKTPFKIMLESEVDKVKHPSSLLEGSK